MNAKFFSLILIVLVCLIPRANGITGSIGNAKAIVTLDLRKSNVLERTVLVKNVNNVSLDIKLEVADDLEGITELIDNQFTLKEKEEKNARFKVTIPKEGTYNGNIVVFFKPPEGKGAGVALQSNWIIKAINGGGTIFPTDSVPTNNENTSTPNNNNVLSGNNVITGSTVVNSINERVFSPALILFLVLVAIIVVSGFIILMRKI